MRVIPVSLILMAASAVVGWYVWCAEPSHQQRRVRVVGIASLIVYVLVGLPLAIAARDSINMDTFSYLRGAVYWANGQVSLAINGVNAPMMSWLTLLGMKLGGDAALSMHLVMFAAGLPTIVLGWMLLKRFELGPLPTALGLGSLVAFCLLTVNTNEQADLLAVAFQLPYLLLASDPRILTSTRRQLAAGVLVGLGYLARYTSIILIGAHFPGLLALHVLRSRPPVWRSTVKALALGVAGFVLVGGPWILAMSMKYGSFTVSRTIQHALSVMNTNPPPGFLEVIGLRVPVPPRLNVIEEVADVPDIPFDWTRPQHLTQLARTSQVNTFKFLDSWPSVASFGVIHVGVLASLLLCLVHWKEEAFRFRQLWVGWTIVIYPLLHIPFYMGLRYFWLLMPLFIGLSFQALSRWERHVSTVLGNGARGWRTTLAVLIPAALITAGYVRPPVREIASGFTTKREQAAVYRTVADRLRSSQAQPPLATNAWQEGLSVTYHLSFPYYGVPDGCAGDHCDMTRLSNIIESLCRFRVGTMLVFDDETLAGALERRFGSPTVTVEVGASSRGSSSTGRRRVAAFDAKTGCLQPPVSAGERGTQTPTGERPS